MLDKHVPVSLLHMFLYICLTLTWMLDKHVAHSLNFSTISVSLLRMFLYICLTHSNLDVWQLSLFISLSIPLAVSLPLCLCLSITWMVAISVYPYPVSLYLSLSLCLTLTRMVVAPRLPSFMYLCVSIFICPVYLSLFLSISL